MEIDIGLFTVTLPATIGEVLEVINRSRRGMALVVGEKKHLIATVSDGDVRRGFLKGLKMEDSVEFVMNKEPLVAPVSMSVHSRRELMRMNGVRHLPLVDEEKRLVSMEWQTISGQEEEEELTAMIMAGGEGQRLRPLTADMPKPMLKVDGKPLLHIILDRLKKFGFRNIIINVRYLGHEIEEYFGNGKAFNVKIDYIHEGKPLGTAGSISLIPERLKPLSPFLVLNGDLMSTMNLKVFWEFHKAAGYDFTLCGRPYEVKIPFGYPIIEGDLVKGFKEKPTFTHLVNSGIYCLSPGIIEMVPVDTYYDMPDLIRQVIDKRGRVGIFPLREKFHEIGTVESYKNAEQFYVENIKGK